MKARITSVSMGGTTTTLTVVVDCARTKAEPTQKDEDGKPTGTAMRASWLSPVDKGAVGQVCDITIGAPVPKAKTKK